MNLSDMVRAAHARMADVMVDVDESFGSVSIGDPDNGDEGCVFMQGDEADQFIESARSLYEELGDVTIDEVWAYLAEPYAETLL
jgi:hypothetical protein